MALSNIERLIQLVSLITQSSQGNDVIVNQIQSSINFLAEKKPEAMDETLKALIGDTVSILTELDSMTMLLASVKAMLNSMIGPDSSKVKF